MVPTYDSPDEGRRGGTIAVSLTAGEFERATAGNGSSGALALSEPAQDEARFNPLFLSFPRRKACCDGKYSGWSHLLSL